MKWSFVLLLVAAFAIAALATSTDVQITNVKDVDQVADFGSISGSSDADQESSLLEMEEEAAHVDQAEAVDQDSSLLEMNEMETEEGFPRLSRSASTRSRAPARKFTGLRRTKSAMSLVKSAGAGKLARAGALKKGGALSKFGALKRGGALKKLGALKKFGKGKSADANAAAAAPVEQPVDQQAPAQPVEQQQAPAQPVEQQQAPVQPVEQQQAPAQPVEQQQAPAQPVEQPVVQQQQALAQPVEQQAPVQQSSAAGLPVFRCRYNYQCPANHACIGFTCVALVASEEASADSPGFTFEHRPVARKPSGQFRPAPPDYVAPPAPRAPRFAKFFNAVGKAGNAIGKVGNAVCRAADNLINGCEYDYQCAETERCLNCRCVARRIVPDTCNSNADCPRFHICTARRCVSARFADLREPLLDSSQSN